VYVLNPSIDDLLEQNVYKLVIENEIYFVPLWHIHSDILYDKVVRKSNEYDRTTILKDQTIEIIVRCVPELPENIWIDENENIHVKKRIDMSVTNVLDIKLIDILVGKKHFEIPVETLHLKRNQVVVLKGKGLSTISNHLGEELNQMDLNEPLTKTYLKKKNIIVHIELYTADDVNT